eukprot:scaffold290098_cov29-Tisochrysis_lutea.AAC.3
MGSALGATPPVGPLQRGVPRSASPPGSSPPAIHGAAEALQGEQGPHGSWPRSHHQPLRKNIGGGNPCAYHLKRIVLKLGHNTQT